MLARLMRVARSTIGDGFMPFFVKSEAIRASIGLFQPIGTPVGIAGSFTGFSDQRLPSMEGFPTGQMPPLFCQAINAFSLSALSGAAPCGIRFPPMPWIRFMIDVACSAVTALSSRRPPPAFPSVWHVTQDSAKTGRTLFSKKVTLSGSSASVGACDQLPVDAASPTMSASIDARTRRLFKRNIFLYSPTIPLMHLTKKDRTRRCGRASD